MQQQSEERKGVTAFHSLEERKGVTAFHSLVTFIFLKIKSNQVYLLIELRNSFRNFAAIETDRLKNQHSSQLTIL